MNKPFKIKVNRNGKFKMKGNVNSFNPMSYNNSLNLLPYNNTLSQQFNNSFPQISPQESQNIYRNPYGNLLNLGNSEGTPLYNSLRYMKDGGIYIKPQNIGKFTASANRAEMGVQEFARHLLANPEDYSPLQRKRANFDSNTKSWNK